MHLNLQRRPLTVWMLAVVLCAGCSNTISYRFDIDRSQEVQPEADIRLKRVDFLGDIAGTVLVQVEVTNKLSEPLRLLPQENELDLGPGTIADSLEGVFHIWPRQRKTIPLQFVTGLPAPPKQLSLYLQGLITDDGQRVPATFEFTTQAIVEDD